MNSVLIVSENDKTSRYRLDEKDIWEVGRPFKEINPDIKLYSKSVSRRHGAFRNVNGYWFYIDNNRKNGTTYNGNRIETGIGGRVKPIMLKDGDELVFGGGNGLDEKNLKYAVAVFMTREE